MCSSFEPDGYLSNSLQSQPTVISTVLGCPERSTLLFCNCCQWCASLFNELGQQMQ
jgi:hypothetical protein